MTMRDNSNLRNESVQECGERSRVHSCLYNIYVLWSLLSDEVHGNKEPPVCVYSHADFVYIIIQTDNGG